MSNYLRRWAEETLENAEPAKPSTAAPDPDPDMARRQAALEFVTKAGARLLCPDCFPDLPPGAPYAIAVPAANDDARFRDAVRTLKLDRLPIVPRRVPLGFRPEDEHQKWSNR